MTLSKLQILSSSFDEKTLFFQEFYRCKPHHPGCQIGPFQSGVFRYTSNIQPNLVGLIGNAETYTCGSDSVLTGNPVVCESPTTTTTTLVTLLLTGFITIEPQAVWPSTLKYVWLLEEFTTDPTVKSAVQTALASVFNVSTGSIQLNITIENVTSEGEQRRLSGMKEVVLVEYAGSRTFTSAALAKEWASAAITGEEVQAAINAELAAGSSLLRGEVLDFQLQIAGVPEDSEDPPGG